eukprot:8006439-Pyramimonas_sp.AAC.1
MDALCIDIRVLRLSAAPPLPMSLRLSAAPPPSAEIASDAAEHPMVLQRSPWHDSGQPATGAARQVGSPLPPVRHGVRGRRLLQ